MERFGYFELDWIDQVMKPGFAMVNFFVEATVTIRLMERFGYFVLNIMKPEFAMVNFFVEAVVTIRLRERFGYFELDSSYEARICYGQLFCRGCGDNSAQGKARVF